MKSVLRISLNPQMWISSLTIRFVVEHCKTLLIDASQSDSMPKVLNGVNVVEVASHLTDGLRKNA